MTSKIQLLSLEQMWYLSFEGGILKRSWELYFSVDFQSHSFVGNFAAAKYDKTPRVATAWAPYRSRNTAFSIYKFKKTIKIYLQSRSFDTV